MDRPNGIYKLKLFHHAGFDEIEIDIDNDSPKYSGAFGQSITFPKVFNMYPKGIGIEYFNRSKNVREFTNLPYILTFDREFNVK